MTRETIETLLWIAIGVMGAASFSVGYVVCAIRHEMKREASLK